MRGNVKKFGISKLLDSGVYKAAYPLHDVIPCDLLTHTCCQVNEEVKVSVWFILVPV